MAVPASHSPQEADAQNIGEQPPNRQPLQKQSRRLLHLRQTKSDKTKEDSKVHRSIRTPPSHSGITHNRVQPGIKHCHILVSAKRNQRDSNHGRSRVHRPVGETHPRQEHEADKILWSILQKDPKQAPENPNTPKQTKTQKTTQKLRQMSKMRLNHAPHSNNKTRLTKNSRRRRLCSCFNGVG